MISSSIPELRPSKPIRNIYKLISTTEKLLLIVQIANILEIAIILLNQTSAYNSLSAKSNPNH